MNLHECEDKLVSLAKDMMSVYKEYRPEGKRLLAYADASGYIDITADSAENALHVTANNGKIRRTEEPLQNGGTNG